MTKAGAISGMAAGRRMLCGFVALAVLIACAGGASAYSVEQERRLGEEVSKQAESEMPLSENEQWRKDIAEMGKRFMPHISRKEFDYQFRIVAPKDKDQVNAFAIPGGYIYFTERMWRILTPDERAAVMAHEITHCDRRHGVDMMLKSRQRALWLLPLIVLGGGTGLGYAAFWGEVLIAQRYSRKMEREADEYGIKLLAAAGYNPAAAVTSMKKLLYIESDHNRYEMSPVFASHPDTEKRIEYLSSAAIELGAKRDELELRMVDDPARIGNITSKVKDSNVVSARATIPLDHGQKVVVKKLLWDDEVQALAPRTVAVATVISPGRFPVLAVERQDGSSFGDVMPGDGIYPASPEPAGSTALTTHPRRASLRSPAARG